MKDLLHRLIHFYIYKHRLRSPLFCRHALDSMCEFYGARL